MREKGIHTLLVKGQGIAQCYEKPLWRASGDVDLLLSDSNYQKAKEFLLPLSSGNKPDERYSKHLGMNIDQWYVEIHGTLRTGLSGRIDKEVDDNQNDVFNLNDDLNVNNGRQRVWKNGNTDVMLPAPTEDVFFVFTHFIKHFYKEGMTLRQICDWCRLLWTFRDKIDVALLEKRLKRAGLMTEWQVFYTLATKFLGMPEVSGSIFQVSSDEKLEKKADRLVEFILKGYTGCKVKDTYQIAKIFPWKALRYSPSIFMNLNWLKIKERLC